MRKGLVIALTIAIVVAAFSAVADLNTILQFIALKQPKGRPTLEAVRTASLVGAAASFLLAGLVSAPSEGDTREGLGPPWGKAVAIAIGICLSILSFSAWTQLSL